MIIGDRNAPLGRSPRPTKVAVSSFFLLAISLLPFLNGCAPGGTATQFVGDLPAFEIEEDLRIDGHAANLVPIFWLGVAPDGTIAAIQRQLGGVRFFDSVGNDLGLVGREGEGPEEFRVPSRAGWMGDTLWVSDFMLKRIMLISTEPAFVRTLPPFRGARPAPEDEVRLPTVSMFVPSALYPGGRLLIPASGGEVFEGRAFFHVSGDGLVERLVLEIPRDPEERSITIRSEGGVVSGYSVPFYPRTAYTAAPDGSRIGLLTTAVSGPEEGTFRVSIYDAFGGEIFSRAYPYRGVPIPDHAVDSALTPRDLGPLPPGMTVTRPRRPPRVERELRSRVPPFYPPVENILIGADGRSWISLYRRDESEEWLILDADGTPQGRVVLPARTRLTVANETHLWALERDEFDVESIVRYRVLHQE